MDRNGLILGGVLTLIGLTGTAHAVPVNLLTNPGFETGDFTGWVVGGNTPGAGVSTDGNPIAGVDPRIGPSFTNVRSGNFAASALVSTFPLTFLTLSQTLAVVVGQAYSVGFWVNVDAPGIFGVGLSPTGINVNGSPLSLSRPSQLDTLNGFNGSGPTNFALVSGSFTAVLPTATVNYTPLTGSGTWIAGLNFDDFHFVAEPVPEPATLLLVGSGLLGLVARRRRAA